MTVRRGSRALVELHDALRSTHGCDCGTATQRSYGFRLLDASTESRTSKSATRSLSDSAGAESVN
jgi:hypothetical protein